MAKRKVQSSKLQDIWKTYEPGPDAPRYYGVEFTSDEKQAVYRAIKEKTGLNYVLDHLMWSSMHEFGRAHGVPFGETYCDDALVYCCIQLGIDYRKFPHNTPKLPIDGFIELAKRRFTNFKEAQNNIQRAVQRSKLVDLWSTWVESECVTRGCPRSWHSRCDDVYSDVDFDGVGLIVAKNNSKRAKRVKFQPLRLVHSSA